MSRRTIAHAQRVLETHSNRDANGTWTTAHYVPQGKGKVQRDPYGLFVSAGGEAFKFITILSGRFGRAMRKAHRDGRYYPGAFMSHITSKDGKPYPTGTRWPAHKELKVIFRGQAEARAQVNAKRPVDWDKPGFIEQVREHMAEQGL